MNTNPHITNAETGKTTIEGAFATLQSRMAAGEGNYLSSQMELPHEWAALLADIRSKMETERRRRWLREVLVRTFSASAEEAAAGLLNALRGSQNTRRRRQVPASVLEDLRPHELDIPPHELRGSESTLLVIQSLLLLLPMEHRRGAVSTSSVKDGVVRLQSLHLTVDTLRTLWKEMVQRQSNLQRALFDPVQGEDGLAARFIALERARRLVEAALGCSRKDLTPLE